MSDYKKLVINQLNELSIPYVIEKQMKLAYKDENHKIYDEARVRFQNRVDIFIGENRNTKFVSTDLFSFYNSEFNFKSRAAEISTYFKQGSQMLTGAFNSEFESKPLLDYYGYLQCVKGLILSMVDINQEIFFSTHGLIENKKISENKSQYLDAKIKFNGVFSAIMLCDLTTKTFPRYKEINEIYNGKYLPKLEDVMYITYNRDPKSIFIGTWMLSTLARYKPIRWYEILKGENDDFIKYIFEFWDQHLPITIFQLLDKFRAFRFGQWQVL